MKNKFQKLLLILGVLTLVFAFTACGNKDDGDKDAGKTESGNTDDADDNDGGKDDADENKADDTGDSSEGDDQDAEIYEYLKERMSASDSPVMDAPTDVSADDYAEKAQKWAEDVQKFSEDVIKETAEKFNSTEEKVSMIYLEKVSAELTDLAGDSDSADE